MLPIKNVMDLFMYILVQIITVVLEYFVRLFLNYLCPNE